MYYSARCMEETIMKICGIVFEWYELSMPHLILSLKGVP